MATTLRIGGGFLERGQKIRGMWGTQNSNGGGGEKGGLVKQKVWGRIKKTGREIKKKAGSKREGPWGSDECGRPSER